MMPIKLPVSSPTAVPTGPEFGCLFHFNLSVLVFGDHGRRIESDIAIAVQVLQGAQPLECRGLAFKNTNQHLIHDSSPSVRLTVD